MKRIFVFCVAVMLGTSAFASESMSDIAQNKQMKAAVISNLQAMIARHETMSHDAIVADLSARLNVKAAALSEQGVQLQLGNLMTKVATLDKNGIIAMENQELMRLETSANVIFLLTRSDFRAMKEDGRYNEGNVFFESVLLPFAIAIDIACLPLTFIGSALTGF